MEFTKCKICNSSIRVDNINEHEFTCEYGKVTMMIGDEVVLINTKKELDTAIKRVRKIQ